MNYFYYFLIVFWLLLMEIGIGKGDLNSEILKKKKNSHSVSYTRKRRYVVFPEGSTFSLAVSFDQDASIQPPPTVGIANIFTTGVAWALSYDLPNETMHAKNNRNKFSSMIRRHKRELYIKAEKLMNCAGFEGKNCILKTICEAAANLSPKQGVLEEILRLIFTYPEDSTEEKTSNFYIRAHKNGELNENCDVLYPCPMSLLELGLGFEKYILI